MELADQLQVPCEIIQIELSKSGLNRIFRKFFPYWHIIWLYISSLIGGPWLEEYIIRKIENVANLDYKAKQKSRAVSP